MVRTRSAVQIRLVAPTIKPTYEVGFIFLSLDGLGGFEGGSRFAGAKRFALRCKIKMNLKAKDDVDNVGAGRPR